MFPAWDIKHNAEFELYARDGFKVKARIEDGVIAPVIITSTLGGECLIANPWDSAVTMESEDGEELLEGEILSFDSRKGVEYTLSNLA